MTATPAPDFSAGCAFIDGQFVPIAEEAGLIAPIGEWALRRACEDAAQWPGNVKVSVNVSPRQLIAGDFAARRRISGWICAACA